MQALSSRPIMGIQHKDFGAGSRRAAIKARRPTFKDIEGVKAGPTPRFGLQTIFYADS
jgi:hypothetical protein